MTSVFQSTLCSETVWSSRMEARATRSAPSLVCNSLNSTLRTVMGRFPVSDAGSRLTRQFECDLTLAKKYPPASDPPPRRCFTVRSSFSTTDRAPTPRDRLNPRSLMPIRRSVAPTTLPSRVSTRIPIVAKAAGELADDVRPLFHLPQQQTRASLVMDPPSNYPRISR